MDVAAFREIFGLEKKKREIYTQSCSIPIRREKYRGSKCEQKGRNRGFKEKERLRIEMLKLKKAIMYEDSYKKI
jgi:hypothetical protein